MPLTGGITVRFLGPPQPLSSETIMPEYLALNRVQAHAYLVTLRTLEPFKGRVTIAFGDIEADNYPTLGVVRVVNLKTGFSEQYESIDAFAAAYKLN